MYQEVDISAIQTRASAILEKYVEDKHSDQVKIIEKFIKSRGLYVQHNIHLHRLYTVFCDNPLVDSNDLANLLFESSPYVETRTLIPHREFSISVMTREMVRFHRLDKYKDKSIEKLITPEIIGGFKIVPTIMEMITNYSTLYDISHEKNWEECKVIESELFSRFKPQTGGAEGAEGPDAVTVVNTGELVDESDNNGVVVGRGRDSGKAPTLQEIYDAIRGAYGVFVGHMAANVLNRVNTADSFGHQDRIQIVVKSYEDTAKQIFKLIAGLHGDPNMQNYNVKLPVDFRIERTTIYSRVKTGSGVRNIPVVDVFNSASYELIPYIAGGEGLTGELGTEFGPLIGHPTVVIKFLLIDLWIHMLRNKIGDMHDNIFREKQSRISDCISRLRELKMPIEHVYGIFYDPKIALKDIMRESKFYPYVPARHKKEFGRLREIKKHFAN